MGANQTAQLPVKLKRPATLDHLRKKPKPWRIVNVCMDPDKARSLEEAEQALATTEASLTSDAAGRDKVLAPLREVVETAKAAVEDASEQVLVQSIGRVAYDALVDEHPPTDEDHAQLRQVFGENAKAGFHHKTFSVALIAASTLVPRITEEEVTEITADWTASEFQKWADAAAEVNRASTVSLGKFSTVSNGTNGSTKS